MVAVEVHQYNASSSDLHFELELKGTRTLTEVVRQYYYAGGQRVALREGETLYYFLSDHLGSTSITTDSAGNQLAELRYTPWGESRASGYAEGDTPTDYRFTGQRATSFGLLDYNARYYDPALGRFISADMIQPQPGNSLAWDRYGYVSNNPINATDPSGYKEIRDGNNIRYTPIITVGYKLQPKVKEQLGQSKPSVVPQVQRPINCIGSTSNEQSISSWPSNRGENYSHTITMQFTGNPYYVDDYDPNEGIINGVWGSVYNGTQLLSEIDRFINPPSGPILSIVLSGDISVVTHGRIPEINYYEESIVRFWSVEIDNPSADYILVSGSINSTSISPIWVEPNDPYYQQIPLTVCLSCEVQFAARTLGGQYYSWEKFIMNKGR